MLYPVACYIILFKAVRVWWTLVLLDFSFGWLFSNLFDTYPFYHGLIMWQEFQVNCSLVDINGKILAGKHGMTRFALFAWTWLKLLGMNPWWNSSRKNLHQTYTRRFSIFFWKFCMKSPKPAPNIQRPPSWTEVFPAVVFFGVGDNDGEGPYVVCAAVPNGDLGRLETSGWRRHGGGNWWLRD